MKYFDTVTTRRIGGFTIVEMVVVITIIGILAALTVGAYNGIQTRARDSTRVGDMRSIGKALELHRSRHGDFPARSSSATSWASSATYPNDYITGLHGPGLPLKNLPVDPKNNSTHYYQYYVYAKNTNGCDPDLGKYYVLIILRMESVPTGTSHPDSPGFKCASRDWGLEGGGAAWVQGGYVNG